MKKYQIEFEGKVIGTRKSDRTYTHAIVVTALPANYADPAIWPAHWSPEQVANNVKSAQARLPGVLGYCGSLALAQKSPDARRKEKAGFKTQIVPVTVIGGK